MAEMSKAQRNFTELTSMSEASEGPAGSAGNGSAGPGEHKQTVFEPYRYDPPGPPSRAVWVVLGVAGLLLVGGIIYTSVRPREAAAQSKTPDFRAMTVPQLVEDASAEAAYELTRRMYDGTLADRLVVTQAVQNPSPRLARNMAMAMATAAQKRQAEVMAKVQRNIRMCEEER